MLNTQYPPCKVRDTLFRGWSTCNSTSQSRSLIPSSTKLFPYGWKGAFPALQTPCWGRLPAGMQTEPSEVMAWWEQAGGGREEGRGYCKEVKNANHALSNVLPPKLVLTMKQEQSEQKGVQNSGDNFKSTSLVLWSADGEEIGLELRSSQCMRSFCHK